MTIDRFYALEVEGCSAPLAVVRVDGRERLHAPASFVVTAISDDTVVPADLLTQKATLDCALPDGTLRTVAGYVDAVEVSGIGLTLTVVPKLALLADTCDHRVYVDMDAMAIVEKVLADHGITMERRITGEPQKRAQCVQLFESDLDFVCRLLAEEGAALFTVAGAADAVVVCDHDGGWEPVPDLAELEVRESGGMEAGEAVFQASLRRARVHDKVTLRDYQPETPLLDQTASAKAEQEALEHYEYPGGYKDPGGGGGVAQLRLDELRGRRSVLVAHTSCRRLSPGHVLSLNDVRRDDVTGQWLVIEVDHSGRDGAGDTERSYRARFTAVPADACYRPARRPVPRVGGVQTATMTGPGGAEIHSEAMGRTRLHLRWDRELPFDDTASALVRVVQPPTSGGFFMPRIGWENLLFFQQGSADVPWVLGRAYNGQAPPPSGLPGKKVVSAFGTETTPGRGAGNSVQMDDSAGNEAMSFNASKNFNERTENTKNTKVTADEAWTVGSNRNLIVGQVLSQKVAAAQTYTVGANRTVNVTSDSVVSSASETVLIGGLRSFDVGGDYKTSCATLTRLVGAAKVETAIEHVVRAVQGAQTVLVGGTWSATTGVSHNVATTGAATEVVAGAKSIKGSKLYVKVRGAHNETLGSRSTKAGGDREEGFGASATYTIGGAAKMQASEITIKATSKITLSAGGAKITITSSSIEISGDFKSAGDSADKGDQTYGD